MGNGILLPKIKSFPENDSGLIATSELPLPLQSNALKFPCLARAELLSVGNKVS